MRHKAEPGNRFLFCIIKFLNLLFGASALTLIALSIWLWAEFDSFSIIEMVFLTLGFFEVLVVLLAWTGQTSSLKLKCSMYALVILLLVELTTVIIVFVLGDDIINKVAVETGAELKLDKLRQYLNIVNYFIVASLVVELTLILAINCYIASFKNRNPDDSYATIDQNGKSITAKRKRQNERKRISEKYESKKLQLQNQFEKSRKLNLENESLLL